MNTRAAAARVIAGVIDNRGSLASLVPLYLSRIADPDRALFQDFCYGTLRWYPKIEVILKQLLSKPLKTRDSDLQGLLAVGIYQITETRIPDHAAINETVAAAAKLQKGWAKALLNGVLRNFLRQQDTLLPRLSGNSQFTTAHPQWLLEIWQRDFPSYCQQIILGNNQRPPMTLRVNRLKSCRDDFIQRLANQGVTSQPTPFSASGVTLSEPTDVKALEGFSEGCVSVQDEAAQLAACLLEPAPGDYILDACCAPGGKTCHLLELTADRADVLALDIDSGRLARVKENLERLSLSAKIRAADALETTSWWDGKLFDRILLDAPCSATGVIRRHPDIKLLRRPEDADKLAARQLAMLTALWPTLRDGGLMLYATCSTLPQENDQVIDAFVELTPEAAVLPVNANWGIATESGRQLFPQPGGNDGFYYAKLQKRPID